MHIGSQPWMIIEIYLPVIAVIIWLAVKNAKTKKSIKLFIGQNKSYLLNFYLFQASHR